MNNYRNGSSYYLNLYLLKIKFRNLNDIQQLQTFDLDLSMREYLNHLRDEAMSAELDSKKRGPLPLENL